MRQVTIIAAAVFLIVSSALASQFVTGFEDVPVMPGIAVDEGSAVAFDSPGGRIVQAYAIGNVTRDAVRRFYQTTLPQLGWRRTGALEFEREGEQLTIELLGEPGDAVTAHFVLRPATQQ